MISEAAREAFYSRFGFEMTRPELTPNFVARFRRKAAARGESDPFAEPRAASGVATSAPASARPTPITAPAKPTAADLEFERVRAAALARHEAERQARAEEDATVAFILGAIAKARA